MPNWCSSHHVIYGDRSLVEEFFNSVEEIRKNVVSPEGTYNAENWLGNLVTVSGGDYQNVGCRGWICDSYVEPLPDGTASATYIVEDAWGPNVEPFRMILDDLGFSNSLKHEWIAEEPACEVYVKSAGNEILTEEYFLDIQLEDPAIYTSEYFDSADAVLDWFRNPPKEVQDIIIRNQEITTIADIERLLDDFNSAYEYAYAGLHHFETETV